MAPVGMKKWTPAGDSLMAGLKLAMKPPTGDKYGHHPLCWIRRSQKTRQLLCEGCRRQKQRPRQSSFGGGRARAMVPATGHGLARSDGGDAIQWLDLRCAEAVRGETGNGQSASAEGDQRSEEEKRCHRCSDIGRFAAVQPAAELLRGAAGDPGNEANAAIPDAGGAAVGTDEEPHIGAAEGSGSGIQQRETTRQRVLYGVGAGVEGSAGVGAATVALQPGSDGDVREYAKTVGAAVTQTARSEESCRAVAEHTRRRRNHRTELGVGSGRGQSFRFHQPGMELLRADGSLPRIGRQTAAWSHLQATQSASPNGAG